MRIHQADTQHEVFYQEMVALLDKHAGHISAIEMLAVAANMVGKMIAMQDQRKYRPAQVMDLVASNIEAGNKQAVEELKNSVAGARQ